MGAAAGQCICGDACELMICAVSWFGDGSMMILLQSLLKWLPYRDAHSEYQVDNDEEF